MSFTHHTPVGQPDHSEWQARGRGDARADQRSHVGLRHLRREYAGQYAAAGEVKNAKCRMQNAKLNKKHCPYYNTLLFGVILRTTTFSARMLPRGSLTTPPTKKERWRACDKAGALF